jgi:hypothetical protein
MAWEKPKPSVITQQYKSDAVEHALDVCGDLTEFVQVLQGVLEEKEEHILSTWQDNSLASYYSRLITILHTWF